jgi:hypothetical protein
MCLYGACGSGLSRGLAFGSPPFGGLLSLAACFFLPALFLPQNLQPLVLAGMDEFSGAGQDQDLLQFGRYFLAFVVLRRFDADQRTISG